jgi:hypothetical protein
VVVSVTRISDRIKSFVCQHGIVWAFLPVHLFFGFGYFKWANGYEYSHLAWMLSDDCFYYLKVAQNILTLGFSTFDGFTVTNGYHPVWMLVLLSLGKLSGGINDCFFVIFRIFLAILCLVSGLLLYAICSRLFERRCVRYSVFAFTYYIVSKISFSGMEVALTFPLMFWLILLTIQMEGPISTRKWLAIGALSGIAVLSRLDFIIFVIPYIGLVFLSASPRASQIRGFCLALTVCCSMYGAYLLFNYVNYSSVLPVSALAKQLKKSCVPSVGLLRDLLIPDRPADLFQCVIPLLIAFVGSVVGLLTAWRTRRLEFRHLWIVGYPFIYYSILVVRYDWTIDDWYLYPLPLSVIFAMFVLVRFFNSWRWFEKALPILGKVAVVIVILYVLTSIYRIGRVPPTAGYCYNSAIDICRFSATHPGRLAMGDRAGLAAFISRNSVLQLEGLMSDRRMLKHIADEDDLVSVLNEHKIDYYAVCVSLERTRDGYISKEPQRPGHLAYKMTGQFYEEPIVKNRYPNGTVLWIFRVPGSGSARGMNRIETLKQENIPLIYVLF